MSELPAIVEFLSHGEAYAETPSQVVRIETHISWVFLTKSFAYKLKKPVAFDFLDFRTPGQRREACETEVRLNRRLAESTYLGVDPIYIDDRGRFGWTGTGSPVDWVVKMHRLPADRSLDRLLADGQISESNIQSLSKRLAGFYRSLAPVCIEPNEYRRQIQLHVGANRHDLLRFAADLSAALVERVHGAQLQFLTLQADVFDERVRQGRIVEAHGDLRPEHIYLLPEPTVLDCIEFSEEFRRLDILDELGFLAMECDRLRAAETGDAILRQTMSALGDVFSTDLLAFYKSYRACVRSKVAALRGAQHEGEERAAAFAQARAYLNLAVREAQPISRPFVILVRGISGSGKSTIAGALAERLGAKWLATDIIRQSMFAEGTPERHREARYAPQQRAAVYDELLRRAGTALANSRSVVLDGTFLQSEQCRRSAELAAGQRVPILIVECRCSTEASQERIASRLAAGNSPSEAYPELVATQQREREPLPEGVPSLIVDTTEPTESSVRKVLAQLTEVVRREVRL